MKISAALMFSQQDEMIFLKSEWIYDEAWYQLINAKRRVCCSCKQNEVYITVFRDYLS